MFKENINQPPKNSDLENKELIYTYVDYSDNRKVIFECKTNGGILEADKLFFDKTGILVSKRSDIGCFSTEIFSNQDKDLRQ